MSFKKNLTMKIYQRDLGRAFLIKISLLVALLVFFSVYKSYNRPIKVDYEKIYE